MVDNQEIDAGITRARKYIETGLAKMDAPSQTDYMLGIMQVGYPADFEPIGYFPQTSHEYLTQTASPEVASQVSQRAWPWSGLELMGEQMKTQGVNYVKGYGETFKRIYEKVGFHVVKTVAFDPALASPNWDLTLFGTPDFHRLRFGEEDVK